MTDYTKTVDFAAKDALLTGNSAKLIVGTELGTEFDNLATHSATKYDSGNIASQAEAQAGTDNTVLQTPLRAEEHITTWAAENGSMITNIQALADPGADTILGWDNSATDIIAYTIGDGISTTTTDIHIATGIAGEALTLTSGVLDLDLAALSTIQGTAFGPTDTFVVDVAGTTKGVEYQDLGIPVQLAQTTQTLALIDANTLIEVDATATITIPANSAVAMPIGSAVIFVVDHATQALTVTADTGVILNSIFHPAGGSAASDTVTAGGMAVLIKTATDDWYLSGDITT
jgi:hypothetical protein